VAGAAGPRRGGARRFARERAPALLQAIADVARQSPFRQMVTPGGYTMSVAMTNCGRWAGPPIATATCTPRSIR
jgi:alkylated DNA repair protein (DNA oxidative demethylase)